jgi:type IV pilus assembly protein PilF
LIDADKLAEQYRASLGSSKKNKKRVVVLSPQASSAPDAASLSSHGLKPIMANSVMPTAQQKVDSEEQVAIANKQRNIGHSGSAQSDVIQSIEQNSEQATTNDKAALTQAAVKEKNTAPMVSLPIHIVEKGDSLFAISKHYNIVMKSLERWNKLRRPYILKIGDVLYLANPKSATKH